MGKWDTCGILDYTRSVIMSRLYRTLLATKKAIDPSDSFKITVQSDGEDDTFTIPTLGVGYDYKVETSEGHTFTNQTEDCTITWASGGEKTIEITGDFPRIYFNNGGDKAKLLDVIQWGNIAWSSFDRAFYGCSNMNITATDKPDLSGVINLNQMFRGCSNFNGNIGHWDVSNVNNMERMFQNTPFNQDIGSWNVGNVVSMVLMFINTPFNQDIGSWNVSKVTNMYRMFRDSSFNQDIGGWNVSKVTNMHGMFTNTPFNQDIGGWNVGNVTNMQAMFYGASDFNQDISSWNVSNVTNMITMFFSVTLSTTNYDALLIGWSNRPEYSITKFEQDGANTKVTAAEHSIVEGNTVTISGTISYNGTHEVLEVDGNTFVINAAFVADDAAGVVLKDLKADVSFHAGNSKYSEGDAATAKQKIIDDYNWAITDGGIAE